ncbi:MAG: DUF3313 domain-containing protein [Candidatus Competibacteraceae bacterium]|nr:DUF3313 domain-containing protein [Candidatus Competibacteraceae bacterium]
MHKNRWLSLLLCLNGALLLVGCATSPTTVDSYKRSGFLDETTYGKLQPDPDGTGALSYRNADLTLKKYNKVLLEPIQVLEQARFVQHDSAAGHQDDTNRQDTTGRQAIDPAQLKSLTDYFQQALVKALEPAYPIVNQPGPEVVRVRIAITELTPTSPAMSVVTLVMPFGIVADLASGGATGGTFYLGDTAIETELRDSQSNALVMVYAEKRRGKKYDLESGQDGESTMSKTVDSYARAYTTWGYAEQAFDYWARKLRRQLDQAHGVATPAPATAPASTPAP